MSLPQMRKSYQHGTLEAHDLDPDPLRQFRRWLGDALGADLIEPNAMTLATADAAGRVSARMVLLKGLDDGFVFFSNYHSRKARDLEANPQAALVFYWDALERQVRVEGRVERVSAEHSEAYFRSRPRGSQLGAWASPQSAPIADREVLEESLAAAERRFAGGEVERPEGWGGYRLRPDALELWQGRPSRLHDRFRYSRAGDGWRIERLAP